MGVELDSRRSAQPVLGVLLMKQEPKAIIIGIAILFLATAMIKSTIELYTFSQINWCAVAQVSCEP
jgi:hypothetical protein